MSNDSSSTLTTATGTSGSMQVSALSVMASAAEEAAQLEEIHNTRCDRTLAYPRDFFGPKDGKGPANAAEAAKLWAWRKQRPLTGACDTETPCGELMLKEIDVVRDSLRQWVIKEYKNSAKQAAYKHGVLMPLTNEAPVTMSDLKTIVEVLEPNHENYIKVWHVFLGSCRPRDWLMTVIDAWLVHNNMTLMDKAEDVLNPGEKPGRRYVKNRGGFSRVATQAKGQVVKVIMHQLQRAKGWYVSANQHKVGVAGMSQEKCCFFDDDGNKTEFWVLKDMVSAMSQQHFFFYWFICFCSNLFPRCFIVCSRLLQMRQWKS